MKSQIAPIFTRLSTSSLCFVIIGMCALCATLRPAMGAELLHYDFSASGSSQSNLGTLTGADVIITGTAATAGADGSGVSGQAGDRAFVTGNGGMGASNYPYNGIASGSADLPALTSLTITGWFYATSQLAGSATIFRTTDGSLVLKADLNTPGTMNLVIGGSTSTRSNITNSLYGTTGEWVFFAATWDGATLNFYQANTTTAVSQLGSSISFTAIMTDPAAGIQIGGNGNAVSSDARPFAGSLDSIRLYDTVLSAAQLETIRTADLNPSSIPEPASAGFALGVASLGVVAWLKSRCARRL